MSDLPIVIPLVGASNLRDLGGYRTLDGLVVKRGMVFRSAALGRLMPADLTAVAQLGIKTICDFRGLDEAARAPTRIPGARLVPLPIEPTVGAGLRDILHTKEATGEALFAVLERAYAAYALSSTMQYRQMMDLLLDGGTPLLFHCTAGKDRTGFGAAILLTALGVPWEEVVADFEATNRLWRRETIPSADLPEQVRESLLRADPALLAAAFASAQREYGSIEQYMARALGLTPDRLARLRALLLEDA